MNNLTRIQLCRIALKVAERAVEVWEAKHPTETSLREAIEAVKEYVSLPSERNRSIASSTCLHLEFTLERMKYEYHAIDVVLCAVAGVLHKDRSVASVAIRMGHRAGVPESEIQRFIDEEIAK